MTNNESAQRLRLRPHHLFCEAFSPWNLPERGEVFNEVENNIREILKYVREVLKSGTDTYIEVVEGIDDLCNVCPLCQSGRCQSPQGNEDQVRKWDAIILKGLGISYGDETTAQRIRLLIGDKAPLDFCYTRCKSKNVCKVFSLCSQGH